MNNQRAPHRLIARHHLTHYTPATPRPPRAPDSKTRIPPPPPRAQVEQKKKHVPWTKRDDEELEKDTWKWIQWHMKSLEKERTGQIQSFTIVATGEWPEDGPGDGEHRRQECCGAGQQQVASHQEAPQQQAPQQQAWPQGAPQQGGWQHGAWQQEPYQQGLWQQGLYQQEPWQQGAWQQGPWQQGEWVQVPWQQGAWVQGAWVQEPWQQQQLLAQQAMALASGVAYGTATPGAGYSLANDGRYKPRKNLPGKNERRKLRLLSKQWCAA